ncbi:gluconate 2-dehydrogenase subunit 3 family protein [Planctomonas sp. JC2975]|uniref:gluconate 2-dehydrogenase subunit 3 family protein n=1 Tax=Planctomonas sp. JC2975 TaxID=2729626 RepID=UPI001475B6FE|nr:gluconate 2-dehydrogenase subunit 3 family protein [Planctomonas sp. JC2975]NNC12136.1 gluconate 2-dehydrogenase subunit 3 family protein [Planctomonas sp. JC2975]
MEQEPHWDGATRAALHDRLHGQPAIRFFDRVQESTAKCLLDRLMGQGSESGDETVDLARMVDARLAENQTDGWHFDTMPPDREAWPATLGALNEDAHARFGHDFAACPDEDQCELLEAVRTWGDDRWHGLPPAQVWGLWTRYAATAFYSHPAVWNEIGFPGPAYPRGYKALGVDKREPFEVKDVRPHDDPLRRPGPERRARGTGAAENVGRTGDGGSQDATGRAGRASTGGDDTDERNGEGGR